MTDSPRHRREPEYEGGAQPTPEFPPDQPKKLRGPIFFIVVVIGALLLFAPIGWAFLSLLVAGNELSTSTEVAFWIVWGACVIAFVWMVVSLWRRAA